MNNNIDKYANIKSITGEERYVEFDKEFEQWTIFGLESGFAYGQFSSEEEANSYIA